MEKVNNNKYEYQFRLEAAVIIIINFVDVMETNYPRQIFLFYFNNYFCSVIKLIRRYYPGKEHILFS